MTWVAWRTQRSQLLAVVVGLTLVAAWLSVAGLATPAGHPGAWRLTSYWTVAGLLALPCVVGLATGAPLVASELQHGTVRLAWTQGVTRTRWIITKLGVAAAIVGGCTAGLAVLLGWWSTRVPIPHASVVGGFYGRGVAPFAFDVTGPVVVGYALFSFALGAALGASTGRSGWAFAVGAPLVVAARVVAQETLRPRLVSPVTLTNLTGLTPGRVGAGWLLHQGWLPAGRLSPAPGSTMGWAPYAAQCLRASGSDTAMARCARHAHIHFVTVFQPADHYWALQAGETAIFLGAALILAVTTATFVVRRQS